MWTSWCSGQTLSKWRFIAISPEWFVTRDRFCSALLQVQMGMQFRSSSSLHFLFYTFTLWSLVCLQWIWKAGMCRCVWKRVNKVDLCLDHVFFLIHHIHIKMSVVQLSLYKSVCLMCCIYALMNLCHSLCSAWSLGEIGPPIGLPPWCPCTAEL